MRTTSPSLIHLHYRSQLITHCRFLHLNLHRGRRFSPIVRAAPFLPLYVMMCSYDLVLFLSCIMPLVHPSSNALLIAVYDPNSRFESDCLACSTGNSNVCRKYRSYGLEIRGSWAEYMVVRADSFVPVPGTPQTIPPSIVAISQTLSSHLTTR
jgi:hypothetical protein